MRLKGFFIKEEKLSKTKKPTLTTRRTISSKTRKQRVTHIADPCEVCGLYKNCLSPKMNYTGKGGLGVLIVAEAPGEEEDKKGMQLIGPAGQVLREKLAKFGLDLDRDFWKINAVNCHPPGNAKPTRKQLECCRPMVEKAIQELKPKFIWLLGGKAIESFYMGRFRDHSVTRWRRLCIPDRRYNAWIIPLFHPSYLLHSRGNDLVESLYEKDLRWAISCLRRGEPEFVDPEDYVEILIEFDKVAEVLEEVLRRKPVLAFDYETTGLKPYREGHKILSVSLCFDKEIAYAFPLYYRNHWDQKQLKVIVDLWKRVLREVPLVAHNLKFEDRWSRVILGIEPKNWIWDTMVTAHVLDSRPGFTSLKFQAYLHWGILGYDDEIKSYIRSKDAHSFNKMEQAPLDKLLFYNAIDSLVTYWLYEKQKKELRGDLKRANAFFLKGLKALADAENHGIRMDEEHYEQQYVELTREIKELEQELLNSEEALLFRKKTGRAIKLTSSTDLRILFYDILKIPPIKYTEKGEPSVDKEVLANLENEFAKKLARLRKLLKVRDTYLAQFRREIVNGKMYPVFNLHIARTYRSSSETPNFQNIPARDEDAKRVTRGGIIPSPGFRICEVDYSAIEVRIIACYTKDPVLISYIHDPSSDMHRDQAKEIFILTDEQVTKELRSYAKNKFVFPEFYGSYYKSCARDLWEFVVDAGLLTAEGITVKEHLARYGIKTYERFERHIQEVEAKFWDRFRVVREWQEEMIEFYKRRGYVSTYFGFRRTDPLDRNRIINSPIQGTAFHCLLWSFIRLNEIRKEEGWRTALIGQIHDSIVSDLDLDETDHVLTTYRRVMCEDIRKEFDWIIVPLEIEIEMSPIDKSWYDKKETTKDKVEFPDGEVREEWIMLLDKENGVLATKDEPEVVKEGDVWKVVPF